MGWNRGWAAAVLALLTACGGGGGGGETPQPSSTGPRAALPTVVQDLNPSGERLDYRSRNYFAGAPGDHWTLSQVDSGSTVTMVTRSASDGPGGDVLLSAHQVVKRLAGAVLQPGSAQLGVVQKTLRQGEPV